MAPAFLDRVDQQGQGRGRAGAAHPADAHRLDNLGHRVAGRGGGGQGDVHDAEIDLHQAGQLPADQLARPGDLEDGPLDDLGELRQVAIGVLGNHIANDAGAGDADVERVVGLADAVMGPGHEGAVLGDIGEDRQLGAADAFVRAVGQVLDDVADL
jgi:hypothetical protein